MRWDCLVWFLRQTALSHVGWRIKRNSHLLSTPRSSLHPLPCMELGKPGQCRITRTLPLRSGVYFNEVWGGETRGRFLGKLPWKDWGKARKRGSKGHRPMCWNTVSLRDFVGVTASFPHQLPRHVSLYC